MEKTVILLIGQKGSGKTFIGTLMEREFGIPFIRVEGLAREVKQARHFNNSDYLNDVFKAIEREIRRSLERCTELYLNLPD